MYCGKRLEENTKFTVFVTLDVMGFWTIYPFFKPLAEFLYNKTKQKPAPLGYLS